MEDKNKIWMFLLEDGEIVEIHCQPGAFEESAGHMLGNIYVGRVKKIVPNIGAAFIEIEKGMECYYDISRAKTALFTRKAGKKTLCVGDELVVQISKEAVKTKAPTVSSSLSFTGRYAILTSGNTRIGISGKLPRALREKLKVMLEPLKNDEYGIIIRTNAKNTDFSEVLEEIRNLEKSYRDLKESAETRVCFSCLLQAEPSYISELKNVYTEGLSEIVVEGTKLYDEISRYYEKTQPENLDKLMLADEKGLPLAELYSTDTALERALGERVWLKNGAYMVIQYTEALTVIDVNSGKYIANKNPAEAYLKINLEAAKETAKQLRLRNLSGIIIIDFINLDDEAATRELLRIFRQHLSKDPIQSTLVDVTGLQLVEVTRKKVRRPLHESVH